MIEKSEINLFAQQVCVCAHTNLLCAKSSAEMGKNMNWINLFEKLGKKNNINFIFHEGTSQSSVMPFELADLLSQTNGIESEYSEEIWSFDKLKKYNSEIRKVALDNQNPISKNIIFFAYNGCGEPFGFQTDENGTSKVIIYYPIRNEYQKIADSLEDWAKGWYSGEISI